MHVVVRSLCRSLPVDRQLRLQEGARRVTETRYAPPQSQRGAGRQQAPLLKRPAPGFRTQPNAAMHPQLELALRDIPETQAG